MFITGQLVPTIWWIWSTFCKIAGSDPQIGDLGTLTVSRWIRIWSIIYSPPFHQDTDSPIGGADLAIGESGPTVVNVKVDLINNLEAPSVLVLWKSTFRHVAQVDIPLCITSMTETTGCIQNKTLCTCVMHIRDACMLLATHIFCCIQGWIHS